MLIFPELVLKYIPPLVVAYYGTLLLKKLRKQKFLSKRLANNFDNNKQRHLLYSCFFATTNKTTGIQTLTKWTDLEN